MFSNEYLQTHKHHLLKKKKPPVARLPVGKRMTVALGMLARDGIVLAADTQESDGYFKEFSLKIHYAMTHTSICSNVKSALVVTGAGPGVHLDAVSDELIKTFHSSQDTDIDTFESRLKISVAEFYKAHVMALAPDIDRDFRLIVGVQIEGQFALWTSETTVVKKIIGLEAVGTGAPFAKMALETRYVIEPDVAMVALLSILAINRAKEYDQFSGKSTSVVCLKDNLAYHVPWYLIAEAEKLFARYSGIEGSAFRFALGHNFLKTDDEHLEKMALWLKQLREDFMKLAPQMLKDQP